MIEHFCCDLSSASRRLFDDLITALSSLALRSIIDKKCPEVLEQKRLQKTHMPINTQEIFHILFRYLLCGVGCVFPS